MIFVIATIALKPGRRDEFAAKAAEFVIHKTRTEPGCLFYDLTKSATDPNLAIFVERWENREALEDHFHAEHMLAWRPVSNPMIASRAVEIIHPDRIETL